jgi:hypothetical protein
MADSRPAAPLALPGFVRRPALAVVVTRRQGSRPRSSIALHLSPFLFIFYSAFDTLLLLDMMSIAVLII